ncbi:hypothetical protein M422DRAFT_270010 [Sphaerobolus stellatus SS14]|uniref:F-box domain-containing protein n=1 Tax=Sphaerobolus stellatus (strain SS14) TaxID=990650 RepID=A0A0C9UIE8_SPHS4|nr:hypothetical protein M422DRAFT_270010 [Sphaerobolus stellatus SS14]
MISEPLAPEFLQTTIIQSQQYKHYIPHLPGQHNTESHFHYIEHMMVLTKLRLVSKDMKELVTPYLFIDLWFVHPVQIRRFLKYWGDESDICLLTKCLRVDLVSSSQDITSLKHWPSGFGTVPYRYPYMRYYESYPERMCAAKQKLHQLYLCLCNLFSNLICFDNGYSGIGEVRASPLPTNFLQDIVEKTGQRLQTLHLTLPPNDEGFYNLIPALSRLRELCFSFASRPNFGDARQPSDTNIHLPCLQWLSMTGSRTMLLSRILCKWQLPMLEHLILNLSDHSDVLLPVLEVHGQKLYYLGLFGSFIIPNNDTIQIKTLCPILAICEITANKQTVILEPPSCFQMLIIHGLEDGDLRKFSQYGRLPSTTKLARFQTQLKVLYDGHRSYPNFRYIRDIDWEIQIRSGHVELPIWRTLDDLRGVKKAKIQIVGQNYKPIVSLHALVKD